MLTEEKIPAFLQAVKFTGDGKLSKQLEMTFFITPASYELAVQVAPWIADAMFYEDSDGQMQPRSGVDGQKFVDPKIPLQSMSLYPVTDEEHENLGAMLENVSPHTFCSMRLLPDKPDLTLSFKVTLDRDKLAMELADRYHKKKERPYLTFAPMQAELPLERGNTINGEAMCDVEDCGLVAAVIDDEETTYCRNHVRAAKGQIKELHPERCETPKQAEQRLLSEALDGKGPAYAAAYAKSQDENAGAPIGEPGGPPAVMEVNLEEESRDVAGFINGRNKGGKKKRAPERSAAPEPEQEQPTDDQKVLREALDGQPFPEPEPVEIPLEAIDEYQDMIRRFNIDVLAGDAEKAEAIQEAARSYMEGLQGGPGIMAPDGVGKRLEDATAAPEGEIPIWGQSGNFVVYVPAPGGGCKVRIDLAGMMGVGPFPSFGAHVVDKDKAFISRTGFRSFMGGSIEQRDVITFVVAQIEALIKSDKQLRKGLVMVEPVESEGKKRERRERKGKES